MFQQHPEATKALAFNSICAFFQGISLFLGLAQARQVQRLGCAAPS
jgi:hypothetical protein